MLKTDAAEAKITFPLVPRLHQDVKTLESALPRMQLNIVFSLDPPCLVLVLHTPSL